jgi:hypothetical protein
MKNILILTLIRLVRIIEFLIAQKSDDSFTQYYASKYFYGGSKGGMTIVGTTSAFYEIKKVGCCMFPDGFESLGDEYVYTHHSEIYNAVIGKMEKRLAGLKEIKESRNTDK